MSTELGSFKTNEVAVYIRGYCGPQTNGDPRRISLVITEGIDYLSYTLSKQQAIELAHSILEYYDET